jgi:ankyrin repeat protein
LDYLIQQGASVNAKTDGGETPVMKACFFGEEDLLAHMIFDIKADISAVNS